MGFQKFVNSIKEMYLVLKEDSFWYNLPLKNVFFKKGQETIINKVLKNEIEGYLGEVTLNYNNYSWNINISNFGSKLRVVILDLGDNYGGYYTHGNEILLNIKFCKQKNDPYFNDEQNGGGNGIYKYLTHELHHAFQEYLIKHEDEILKQLNMDLYFKRYIDQMKAYTFGYNRNINCLGFNFMGNLHINPYINNQETNGLLFNISKMFYYLNIVEFEAHKISKERLDDLKGIKNLSFIDKATEKAILMFQERYDYYPNSIDDVVSKVSDCILKLYNNEEPQNFLEASIMYDICCLANLEELDISEEEQCNREQKYENLLRENVKSERLKEYGFYKGVDNQVNKIYPKEVFFEFLNKPTPLQKLLLIERKNNPELVLYLAFKKSDGDIEYSQFASDTLKRYCEDNKHKLYGNKAMREGAKVIFGKGFWESLNIENDTYEENIETSQQNMNQFTINSNEIDEENIEI